MCARALDMPVRFVHFGTIEQGGRTRLEQLIQESGLAGSLEVEEVAGQVADGISRLAAKAPASLIIMGALSREKAVRDLVGSTARRVARRAPCSVLLVSTAGRDPDEWSRFVVGVDGGSDAVALAQTVVNIARHVAPHAVVCLAHEYRSLEPQMKRPVETGMPFDASARADAGHIHLLEVMDSMDTHGIEASMVSLPGRPGQEIARYAEDTRADFVGVVAPAKPLGVMARLLSHPIMLLLDQLPCSVLLYRRGPGTIAGGDG
jgi:nucleotide-binding universal stress UspA family protein